MKSRSCFDFFIALCLLIGENAEGHLHKCHRPKQDSSSTDYCDQSICPKNAQFFHIGCQNDGSWGQACGTNPKMVHMSHKLKKFIVREHNSHRNVVAKGHLHGLPPSGRMLTMQWHDELAQIAEWAVKQCALELPKQCFSTASYRNPGYNAVFNKFKGSQDIQKIVRSQIRAWYHEHHYTKMKSLIKGVSKGGREIGHFLQLMVGLVDRMGCAISSYTKTGWNHQLMICMYSCSTTECMNPIYQIGRTPGDHCICGVNGKFRNQCSKRVIIYNLTVAQKNQNTDYDSGVIYPFGNMDTSKKPDQHIQTGPPGSLSSILNWMRNLVAL